MKGMTKHECRMTNDELMNPNAVIPSEVEESRGETLTTIRRDPSTPLRFAQDDCVFVIRTSSFIGHSSLVIRHYVRRADSPDGHY
jgi:hypothetical protein